jgi:hypothetical protein
MKILTAKQILCTNLIVLTVEDAINVMSLYSQIDEMTEINNQLEPYDTMKLDFLINKALILDWARIIYN